MDVKEFGIPRALLEKLEAEKKPLVIMSGLCVGCGSPDYTQVPLRDHPLLPKGSMVPLHESENPKFY